ncbi:uncharacterized protein TNCV_3814361 [Trichonephila clavipes]|nr:uncharacterized protein TNCV_3814361 [Trichonephila clavipes]
MFHVENMGNLDYRRLARDPCSTVCKDEFWMHTELTPAHISVCPVIFADGTKKEIPSWSHNWKRDSSEKTTSCQGTCQKECSRAHCRCSHRWFAVKGILYKSTIACNNSRCSRHRRIDEADISTAVDQRAANCLEEAVRSFTALQSSYRSLRADVTFSRPLQVFRWSLVHCFQTRITEELFHCTRAHIAQ